GFGIINGVAFETGSKWIWNKNNNFGMLYQAGIIIFNYIDDTYAIDYLDGEKPAASLIFGIGICW
ncbi:MAG: hypothetical protein GXO49_04830, partial [Chlorobi bacterium]|nr:hypothetical protein [Chlorobiota bacterium]